MTLDTKFTTLVPATRRASMLLLAALLGPFAAAAPAYAVDLTVQGHLPTLVTAAPALPIRVDADRMSARLEAVPLGDVLAVLRQALGVRIRVLGEPGAVPVTATVQDVAVEHGIATILSATSYALVYASPRAGDGRLSEIIVLAARGGAASNGGTSPALAEPDRAAQDDRATFTERDQRAQDDLLAAAERHRRAQDDLAAPADRGRRM